jgi:uncharacterized protein YodC (DUF2158 family)
MSNMSKNTIELDKIGSQVKLAEDVFGTIVGINIGSNNTVIYECGWWSGRSYTKDHFNPDQIESTVVDKVRIGFA